MQKIDSSKWYSVVALQAVRDLHSLRVVHHDVKAANFCLKSSVRGEPNVVLIDFGLLEDVRGKFWSISFTLPNRKCDLQYL